MRKIQCDGFTLIELMIVVAIIGVLAAIALPNFVRFQLRTKAAEGRTNLVAVMSAESSFFAEFGQFIRVLPVPAGAPTSVKRTWPACLPLTDVTVDPGQCIIGFVPEGPTYYSYAVQNTTGANGGGGNVSYFADAVSDLDADGALNLWGLEVPRQNSGVASGLVGLNGCTAVFDTMGVAGLLRQVGPCGVGFGQTIF